VSFKSLIPEIEIQGPDAKAAIRQADALVSRALAIDWNFYWAHYVKGVMLVAQNRFEEAIAEADQTLALSPSIVGSYTVLCEANNIQGRPEKCIEYADKAIRLRPRHPLLVAFYAEKAWAALMLWRDDQAIKSLRRTLAMAAEVSIQQALLASELALTGRQVEAREALQRYPSLKGTTSKTIAEFRAGTDRCRTVRGGWLIPIRLSRVCAGRACPKINARRDHTLVRNPPPRCKKGITRDYGEKARISAGFTVTPGHYTMGVTGGSPADRRSRRGRLVRPSADRRHPPDVAPMPHQADGQSRRSTSLRPCSGPPPPSPSSTALR
jgi:hypothetical protein